MSKTQCSQQDKASPELVAFVLSDLKARAEHTCWSEGCARKFDHTETCRKAWRLWADARAEVERAA